MFDKEIIWLHAVIDWEHHLLLSDFLNLTFCSAFAYFYVTSAFALFDRWTPLHIVIIDVFFQLLPLFRRLKLGLARRNMLYPDCGLSVTGSGKLELVGVFYFVKQLER